MSVRHHHVLTGRALIRWIGIPVTVIQDTKEISVKQVGQGYSLSLSLSLSLSFCVCVCRSLSLSVSLYLSHSFTLLKNVVMGCTLIRSICMPVTSI